jgi:hypothetical protein
MSALLGFIALAGCAGSGDGIRTQVFDDGGRVDYSAAGKPVRFTDSSGQLFVINASLMVEQVFDDGSRIEYSAAGKPVRFTDSSGNVSGRKPTHAISSL